MSNTATQASITIHGQTVQVETIYCADPNKRDAHCPELGDPGAPLPVEGWPLAPSEIQARAEAKLVAAGSDFSRRDVLWSLGRVSEQITSGLYMIQEARSNARRSKEQWAARHNWLRGEC